jgi:hypothetical protein
MLPRPEFAFSASINQRLKSSFVATTRSPLKSHVRRGMTARLETLSRGRQGPEYPRRHKPLEVVGEPGR